MTDALVRTALRHWGIEDAAIQQIAQRENRVYRVTTKSGDNYALRVHRPNYQNIAAIKSELLWMTHLKSVNIDVPCPLATTDNELVVHSEHHNCDLLSWLYGSPMGSTAAPLSLPDRQQTFHRIGQLMAQIHTESDDWQRPDDFERPAWDSDGLLGADPLWGRFWENPGLTPGQRNLLLDVREQAICTLKQQSLDYGLIHADLVRENILISHTNLQFIDFDDSGFGYRLFDIATTLFKNRCEPDYPALESSLLAGYRTHRSINTDCLPLFMLIRALTYVGWIIQRMHEPEADHRQQRFISNAIELASSFNQSENKPGQHAS